MDDQARRNDDDERRRRREEREKQQRLLLFLLGFACLIQLFVSLQASRDVVSRWSQSREDEARAFDKRVRDEGGGTPAEGAGP